MWRKWTWSHANGWFGDSQKKKISTKLNFWGLFYVRCTLTLVIIDIIRTLFMLFYMNRNRTGENFENAVYIVYACMRSPLVLIWALVLVLCLPAPILMLSHNYKHRNLCTYGWFYYVLSGIFADRHSCIHEFLCSKESGTQAQTCVRAREWVLQ